MCSSNCVTCRRKLCHDSASASKLWKSRSGQMATGFNGGGGRKPIAAHYQAEAKLLCSDRSREVEAMVF